MNESMSTRKKQKQPRNSIDAIINSLPRMVIPVGNPFQADVPDWTAPPAAVEYRNDPNTLRFLGERTWPIQNGNRAVKGKIGKGRSENCSCREYFGSVKCVNRHVAQERTKLQIELMSAFWKWGLHKMGEKVSETWTQKDQETFDSVMKENPSTQNKDFVKPAMQALPSKNRESIVSYYFNVYVPNRIRQQNDAGNREIGTDDDEPQEMSVSRSNGKRDRDNSDAEYWSESHGYLAGRR